MPLREPWHQRSVVPTCKRGQRPCQAELENAKIARSECLRRKVRQSKKCFSLQFDACGRFLQVDSTLWADLRCPQFAFSQVVAFSRTHSVHFEYANWRDWNCVSAIFRLVAFVRWSQGTGSTVPWGWQMNVSFVSGDKVLSSPSRGGPFSYRHEKFSKRPASVRSSCRWFVSDTCTTSASDAATSTSFVTFGRSVRRSRRVRTKSPTASGWM